MFCNQCEQAAKGIACTTVGVCGKSKEVAHLQNLLIYVLEGLAAAEVAAGRAGAPKNELGHFVAKAVFSTLTNVDFDSGRIVELINKAAALRDESVAGLGGEARAALPDAATFTLGATVEEMAAQGKEQAVDKIPAANEDIRSLKQILLYGMKGVAAYADHAAILGQEDPAVYSFLLEGLAAIPVADLDLDTALGLVMKCGEVNLRAMELLDAGNTGAYGHPEPTPVPLGAKRGKAILVSGHDLRDLELILKQSEGKGIFVYTHGEMLPAHAYPGLKKTYPHLHGHYGTAWQNQAKEFPGFPGAIVMTTNCIQKPLDSYKDRIFTTGLVAWPGVAHIGDDKDFTPVIEKALEMEGFTEDTDRGQVMVGFARNTVLSVADKVIEAVKGKAIRHFFLVAGCDGAKPGRNYYTEFVEKVPEDCMVLTLACGKFRFFDKDLGDIGGIPRLLDVGQCNDAYSAIKIAGALADAFNCGVNDLPLSMVLSWYEQKAVAILLTLFYLGIKDIRLGPSLPAFITPAVLNVLVEKFAVKPISTPDEDLKAILG